jgi:hypothetical protein
MKKIKPTDIDLAIIPGNMQLLEAVQVLGCLHESLSSHLREKQNHPLLSCPLFHCDKSIETMRTRKMNQVKGNTETTEKE